MNTSRGGIENKIKIHYGTADYYKFYKEKYSKKYTEVSRKQYNDIISDANQLIADMITQEGIDFKIPFQLGVLGVRKYKPKVSLSEDGHLINKLPVNPIETRKLWDTNPEAEAKKIYIRYVNKHTNGYVFTLYYFKNKAMYKNKKAYVLIGKRSLKRALAKSIKDKLIDAFIK